MKSPDQIGITWEENQLLMQQLRDKAALENRRQHNIFEVGDLLTTGDHTGLLSVTNVTDKKVYVDLLNPQVMNRICPAEYFKNKVKHATDEEIKAGYRL